MSAHEPAGQHDEHDEHGDGGRDYAAAAAVVDEIGATTLEVLAQWPLPPHHPAVTRLGLLLDRHGAFTILSVALGWCAQRIREQIGAPLDEPMPSRTVRVRYPARAQVVEVEGVVATLLDHALAGVDGVPRLYDAAAMLRHDGAETSRVLVAVLDLASALRHGTATIVHGWQG